MVILASYLHLPAETPSIETFAPQITITLRYSSYRNVRLNSWFPFLFSSFQNELVPLLYHPKMTWVLFIVFIIIMNSGLNNFDVFQSIALIILFCTQIVPSLSSSGYFLNSSDPISVVFDSLLAFRNEKMFLAYLVHFLS